MADRLERWLRPRVMLSVLGALILLILLLAPPESTDEKGPLTSYSTRPYGARALYESVHRLGWPVLRRTSSMRQSLDTSVVYLQLGTPESRTTVEVKNLLAAVRHGAGLLLIADSRSALAESLGVARDADWIEQYSVIGDSRARVTTDSSNDTSGARNSDSEDSDVTPPLLITNLPQMHHFLRGAPARTDSSDLDDVEDASTRNLPLPAGAQPLLRLSRADLQRAEADGKSRERVGAAGLTVGNGRVVIVADPSPFTNDALRNSDGGLLAVRLLEWIDNGHAKRRLVFDEFHQGFGGHAADRDVIARALTDTAPGRAAVQGIVAMLIFLAAVGVRSIPPHARPVIERRSPLEHVDALAQAYAQIGATPLATRRLIRGLRRRNALESMSAADDDAFLDSLVARAPSLAEAVALLRSAARDRRTDAEFVAVGDAIATIERTLAL